MVGLIYGLSRGQPDGWASPNTVAPLAVSVLAFAIFARVERHVSSPLIEFRPFRRLNFLASSISQVLAGVLELGLGYLLPFYLLLVVGVGPVVAGVALIPGTIPIILAGPLAGRVFDRQGGRLPLVAGFVILAVSGLAIGLGATGKTAVALIPGLLLQGVGLGVVLTINDPVGMNAVDDADRGQAAGIINTAEQMGGAIGIAGLGALQLSYYFHLLCAPGDSTHPSDSGGDAHRAQLDRPGRAKGSSPRPAQPDRATGLFRSNPGSRAVIPSRVLRLGGDRAARHRGVLDPRSQPTPHRRPSDLRPPIPLGRGQRPHDAREYP